MTVNLIQPGSIDAERNSADGLHRAEPGRRWRSAVTAIDIVQGSGDCVGGDGRSANEF